MSVEYLHEFVSVEQSPLRIWAAPVAQQLCGNTLAHDTGAPVEMRPVPSEDGPGEGPAVLVVADQDLAGPHRASLLGIAQTALPGRPVVLYGSHHKEVLLDAINTWHAFRLLPTDAPAKAIAEAVRGAHEALTLDLALEHGAEQLHDECRRLDAAVEELRVTQERLLHAERLTTVGRIVGTLIGHARDHLSTLEGFRGAQRDRPADPTLAEELQCAAEGIDGFAALLRDMLDLTEDRAAKAVLRPESLDPLVQRAVRLFLYDPVARGRDVSFMCRSGATVSADRPRLVHVLLNLLRNAAQATEEDGSIEVRTCREDSNAIIEVRDSGCGMSSEVLEQMYTPFFTTKGKAGMGLGLRLSRAAIEAHNGSMECSSKLGEGTCFRIRLPVVDP